MVCSMLMCLGNYQDYLPLRAFNQLFVSIGDVVSTSTAKWWKWFTKILKIVIVYAAIFKNLQLLLKYQKNICVNHQSWSWSSHLGNKSLSYLFWMKSVNTDRCILLTFIAGTSIINIKSTPKIYQQTTRAQHIFCTANTEDNELSVATFIAVIATSRLYVTVIAGRVDI